MRAQDLLKQIEVASPCPVSWGSMTGDDRCRFCDTCEKNVYNFEGMSGAEILELLRDREGEVCGRLYRRADGTVITADCPVAVPWSRSRSPRLVARFAAGALVVGCFVVTGTVLASTTPESALAPPGSLARKLQDTVLDVRVWLGIDPERRELLMGEICVEPRSAQK